MRAFVIAALLGAAAVGCGESQAVGAQSEATGEARAALGSPRSLRDAATTAERYEDRQAWLVAAGDTLFWPLQAREGPVLMRSDGSAAGTTLVRDLRIAPLAPLAPAGARFAVPKAAGNALYFASEGQLWHSDGTAQGTRAVEGAGQQPWLLTAVGPLLFFVATDAEGGDELWRTDGTREGTFRVKDIAPGAASSEPKQLTAGVGELWFTADDGTRGRELWRSDGTAEGTVLAAELGAGAAGDLVDTIHPAAGRAFVFAASADRTQRQLLRVDSPSGTPVLLATVRPPANVTAYSFAAAVAGDTLYFVGADPEHGVELWTSDGTPQGTARVTELAPGAESAEIRRVSPIEGGAYIVQVPRSGDGASTLWRLDSATRETVRLASLGTVFEVAKGAGSRLFFIAFDPEHGAELWKSDGTPQSTGLVKDVRPGPEGSFPSAMTVVGDTLFFLQGAGGNGHLLWRSDGTEAGTFALREALVPPISTPRPLPLAAVDGMLYFAGKPGELLRSSGTPESTRLHAQLSLNGSSSMAWTAMEQGGALLVWSGPLYSSGALWRVDPARSGADLLAALAVTEYATPPVRVGTQVLFRGYPTTGTTGPGVWTTDGTSAGTQQLAPLGPHAPSTFAAIGAPTPTVAYFSSIDLAAGTSLWATDGSPGGTRRIATLAPAGSPTQSIRRPHGFVTAGALTYFVMDDGTGEELWRTDGTEAGTLELSALGQAQGRVEGLTALGSTLYFSASTPAAGEELWRSDGTQAGTVQVADLCPGACSGAPRDLVALGDALYFRAHSSAAGAELWRVDASGATQVRDLRAGAAGSEPEGLRVLGGALYFSAADAEHGRELWRSDGTESGTRLVRDIAPGPGDGIRSGHFAPLFLAPEGELLFAADDGSTGVELWASDGTEGGTRLVADLAPGMISARPAGFVRNGNQLFFSADDGAHGLQLWMLPVDAAKDFTPPVLQCPADVRVQGTTDAGATVSLPAATASDDSGVAPVLSATHASGSLFPVGTTEVTVNARDGAGLRSLCTYRVTVSAPLPPAQETPPRDEQDGDGGCSSGAAAPGGLLALLASTAVLRRRRARH